MFNSFPQQPNGEALKQIESIQKTSLKIIFGQNYISYEDALEKLGLQELSARREKNMPPVWIKKFAPPYNKFPFPTKPNLRHTQCKNKGKVQG